MRTGFNIVIIARLFPTCINLDWKINCAETFPPKDCNADRVCLSPEPVQTRCRHGNASNTIQAVHIINALT